jgi:hypothetical protein
MMSDDILDKRISYAMNPESVESTVFKKSTVFDNNKSNVDSLFFNKISYENHRYLHTLGKSGHTADYIRYRYNSFGYRSSEFKTDENILVAGCSQTFGMGVEEKFTWGNVVATHFNSSFANLSVPGSSTESIVNNIFAYFKEFGHPKVLIAFFPDMYRFQIPTNRNYITSSSVKTESNNIAEPEYLTYLHLDRHDQSKRPKYQKSPFNLDEILTSDIAFFHNMKSIMILDQYCSVAGVKFYWSTWYKDLDLAISKIKRDNPDEYINYVSSEFSSWFSRHSVEKDPFGVTRNLISSTGYHGKYALDCEKCNNNKECLDIIECHQELKQEAPAIFEFGNDKVHMGTHEHRHLAEIFINRMAQDAIII